MSCASLLITACPTHTRLAHLNMMWFEKLPLFSRSHGGVVVALSQQSLLLLLAGTKRLKATVVLAEQLPCSLLADSELPDFVAVIPPIVCLG